MSSDSHPAPPADLLAAATEAHATAYCPYSRYHVGVALRTVSGAVITGCNVENAAFPLGTCAEAGTISAMVRAGHHRIAEVVIVTDGARPGTPCGGCRQRLREFAALDVLIHCTTVDGQRLTRTLGEFLPDSFGPEDLSEMTGKS